MRVSSINTFITTFAVLSTLLVPTLPASLGISQVLAQTQDVRKQEADKLQFFVGKSQPKIQIIKGAHFGTETSERVFKGATWIFYPDGKFIFNPSENANVRQDLYPIIGTYSKNNNNLIFRGEKQSNYNSTASVDGIIRIEKNSIILEVINTVSALNSQKIVKITQTLIPNNPSTYQEPVTEIAGVLVPSTFDISIIGKTESQQFNSLTGSLKIVSPANQNKNPFSVTLTTDSLGEVGSIFWNSFTKFFSRPTISHEMSVNQGNVVLETKEQQNIISNPSVAWFTLPQTNFGTEINNLPIGVEAKSGTLSFSIQGENIYGKITAKGVSPFGKPSSYEATFTGKKRNQLFVYPEQQQKSLKKKILKNKNQNNH